jgi:glyoxylase I family protein
MAPVHHICISCADMLKVEEWYSRHFDFRRRRVYLSSSEFPLPAQDQDGLPVAGVIIGDGGFNLELLPATVEPPVERATADGPSYPAYRHFAFSVDDLDAKLAEMGDDAKITLGPVDMGGFIPGMRVVWISDPEGNIVELNQGYVDQADPPQAPFDR